MQQLSGRLPLEMYFFLCVSFAAWRLGVSEEDNILMLHSLYSALTLIILRAKQRRPMNATGFFNSVWILVAHIPAG
ncbi:hypothetical protein JW998_01130, partial [candidate division KSB1 bacterium]|nr:hypothetical protein [candidate division KSB1 bacterium]